MEWPGFRTTAWYYTGETQESTKNWMGSLLEEQRDAGGLLYMRNRYYDPETGQFTQADPIGLAGGLNTYGFAAGDPVSYSDPYGLSPFDCITNPTLACKVGHAITRFFFGPPPDPDSKSGELASPGMADPVAAITGAAATRMVVGRSLGTGAAAGAIAQRGASETGEHIVLGLADSGLERTAAAVGGRHPMGDANWRITFMAAVGNPCTTITVSLDGLSGSSTYQQVMGAVQRGAAGQAGHTNWELAQLWQAGRLGTVDLVRSVGTKIERALPHLSENE